MIFQEMCIRDRSIPGTINLESTLSYLGLGLGIDTPSLCLDVYKRQVSKEAVRAYGGRKTHAQPARGLSDPGRDLCTFHAGQRGYDAAGLRCV